MQQAPQPVYTGFVIVGRIGPPCKSNNTALAIHYQLVIYNCRHRRRADFHQRSGPGRLVHITLDRPLDWKYRLPKSVVFIAVLSTLLEVCLGKYQGPGYIFLLI